MSISIDWVDLLARAEEADKPLTVEELELWKKGKIDGNQRIWNVQYVHAAQRAVDGNDPAELHAMMAAEIPAPSFLLPIIARANLPQGGRPRALTVLDDKIIRQAFDWMTNHLNMSSKDARKDLARRRNVKEKTIARSLKLSEAKD